MPFLTVIWNFIKERWSLIVLVFVIAGSVLWFRNQQSSYADAVKQLNSLHQVEIEQINSARAKETAERKQQYEELQKSLSTIQSQYEAARKELEEEQKQERTQIVQKYGNDMNGLSQLLADKMGFRVVPAN